MNRRKLVLSLCAAAALLGSAASHADELADIHKAGVLKVAVPQDFPPFGTVNASMQPEGYDIDMARLIAKHLHVKVELVPVTTANRVPYLQTHKVDLVISSMGKNPDREKVIDFSDAYAPFYNGAFGPADIKVKDAADLAGKSVAVTRGAIEDLALSKIAPPTANIQRYDDNNATISAFLSGQDQIIVTGNVAAAAIAKRHPARMPLPKFLITNSPCFVGLNKGEPALLKEVNTAIADAKKDGALNKISERWLDAPLPKDL